MFQKCWQDDMRMSLGAAHRRANAQGACNPKGNGYVLEELGPSTTPATRPAKANPGPNRRLNTVYWLKGPMHDWEYHIRRAGPTVGP